MWKPINPDLYRNDDRHAIVVRPDKDGKPTPYFLDDDNPSLAIPIIDFLAEKTKVFPSKSEARKMIQGGGAAINKTKVENAIIC